MRILLIALLTAGCARRATTSSEPTLDEVQATVDAQPPEKILLDATMVDDPSPRSRALALLLTTTDPERVATYAAIALADADAWVQDSGVRMLAERIDAPEVVTTLEAYVRRPDAPATTRGLAAELLVGHSDAIAQPLSEAWQAAEEPWDVAPLAFAAALHGDEEAVDALSAALATGELQLDVAFLDRVGRSGLAVLEALRTGQDRVEEELLLPYASARLHLGDNGGEQAFRRTLSDDRALRRMEAVDYLLELDHPASAGLLRRARSVGPEVVTWYADLALIEKNAGSSTILEEAYARDEREVRLAAVNVASRLLAEDSHRKLTKAARRVVETATRDLASEVRAAAFAAAGSVADLEIAFEEGVRDEVLSVRIEAAGAWLRQGEG